MASIRAPRGTKYRSRTARRQEEDAASRFGGKRQPGSGNQWYASGDVRVEELFLLEAKFTDKSSLSLTRKVVEKVRLEAVTSGLPTWVVEVWIRPANLRYYAVSDQLLSAAIENGWVPPSYSSTETVTKKSIRLKYEHFGINPHTYIYGWGDPFAIIGEEIMTEVVAAAQRQAFLDLGTVLHYYMESMNHRPDNRGSGIIGGSSLDDCKRKSWYRLMGVQPKPCFPSNTRVVFEIGHAVHGYLQEVFGRLFGDCFEAEVHATIPEYNFSGSCDGVFQIREDVDADAAIQEFDDMVEAWYTDDLTGTAKLILDALKNGARLGLEIKTCSYLPNAPKQEHLKQAIAYGRALGLTDMCFLYVCKTNGNFQAFVRKVDNPAIWSEIENTLKTLRRYTDDGTEPPRELSHDCSSCQFRYFCKPPGR